MNTVNDRWLTGYYADIYVNGTRIARYGYRSDLGADANEIHAAVAQFVGHDHEGNRRANQNLLDGSTREQVTSGNIMIAIVLKPKIRNPKDPNIDERSERGSAHEPAYDGNDAIWRDALKRAERALAGRRRH